MPSERPFRPPLAGRWFVRAASRLAPKSTRSEWRAHWEIVLENAWILLERGELGRRDLAGGAWHCIQNAWKSSPYSRTSPGAVVAAGVLALAVVGILSHGFARTRALFQPLAVQETDRLVNIRYTGSVGQPAGVPPRLVPVWSSKASLLTGIAGYSHRPYAPVARVTWNFFSLLGARAVEGRLLRAGDRDAAVLSGTAWRDILGGDPNPVGKRVRVQGREYTIVGVLPDSFWAISPRITVWTPLVLESQPDPGLPFLIGAVGKLKPGASTEALRTDLWNAARAAQLPLPRRPEVIPFTALPGRLLFGYLVGIAFAVLVGMVLVLKQQGLQFQYGWRYWRFLAAKIILLTSVPALLWIESSLTGLLLSLPFVVACALAFWWSFADQRRRCPECLEYLGLPVTMGSWSSVLEPASTEFLCQSGHGALCIPETEQGEPDRWTALDPSWREFFDKVGR